MSKNDGGPVIQVSREEVDRPPIRRGEFVLPLDANPFGSIRPGGTITFGRTIEAEDGRRFDLTYHDAEVVHVVEPISDPEGISGDEAGIYVRVGPEALVTWEAK